MNPDEEALFGSLEDVFSQVDAEEHDNFTEWTTGKLVAEMSKLTNKVKERRETLWPKTQEGTDTHSRRNAIQVELHRRGVL